jgi:hypothetical protein
MIFAGLNRMRDRLCRVATLLCVGRRCRRSNRAPRACSVPSVDDLDPTRKDTRPFLGLAWLIGARKKQRGLIEKFPEIGLFTGLF